MEISFVENSFDKDLKDIVLSGEDYRLIIIFSGNGDLYLRPYVKDRDKDYFKINITKDDLVYEYFKKLFDDLCKSLCNMSEYEKLSSYTKVKLYLENISYEEYLNNSKIVFFSDSAPLGECNSVCLSKGEENVNLEFKKNDLDSLRGFTVRISNSGSRHKPLNVSFMRMYNDLQDYKELIKE